MEIIEIHLDGEVYVSSQTELMETEISTQLIENNLWGKNTFLRNDIFCHFTEHGPQYISREEMTQILMEHQEY